MKTSKFRRLSKTGRSALDTEGGEAEQNQTQTLIVAKELEAQRYRRHIVRTSKASFSFVRPLGFLIYVRNRLGFVALFFENALILKECCLFVNDTDSSRNKSTVRENSGSDRRQMKICFVSMWYPPFAVGGAGVYAECLCKELAKLDHEVHVITPQFSCKKREEIENGVVIHRIPVINRQFLWIPCYWLDLRGYYRALRRKLGAFDVVHGNVNSDFSLSRHIVAEPRVVTVHHLGRTTFEKVNPSVLELLSSPGGELGLASWIEKKTLDFDTIVTRRADRVITVSEFCKQEIATKCKVPRSKISVIQNGIYPEEYIHSKDEIETMRKRLGCNDDFMILFVGRLERRKGLPLLLKAFQLVSKSERPKLIVVGSGKQASYRHLAESLNIENRVVFTGMVDNVTLRKIYSACDLFVSSSYLEGFGITLLEAMASEKPVVAMNVGGISEIVRDGVHGRLVSNMNCNELANAILYFAENRESARRIGIQNRKYVIQNFSWRKNAKLTEKVYESMV